MGIERRWEQNGRDKTKIKESDVLEISKNIANIMKVLERADSEAWSWDGDKSEEMMFMAMCHNSKTFGEANEMAAAFSGLFQHVQRRACSMTGSPSKWNREDKELGLPYLKRKLK